MAKEKEESSPDLQQIIEEQEATTKKKEADLILLDSMNKADQLSEEIEQMLERKSILVEEIDLLKKNKSAMDSSKSKSSIAKNLDPSTLDQLKQLLSDSGYSLIRTGAPTLEYANFEKDALYEIICETMILGQMTQTSFMVDGPLAAVYHRKMKNENRGGVKEINKISRTVSKEKIV